MDKIKKYSKHPVVIALAFLLIAVVTFVIFYNDKTIYHGDDLKYHLGRAEHWYNMLQSGSFYSYGNFSTSPYVGVIVDVFYPFITYIPLAFIRYFLVSPVLSWYVYWTIISWITLLICYYAGCQIWKRKGVAILFSLFYFFAEYHLFNLFIRAAVGETLAMTFMPLVILGIYKLIQQEKGAWIPLSLGMTFIAYSHILSTMIVIPFLFILCALNYRKILNKEVLLQLVKAVGLFFLLTAAVIFPMVEQFAHFGVLSVIYEPELVESSSSLVKVVIASFRNTIIHFSLGTMVMVVMAISPFFIRKCSLFIKQLIVMVWILLLFMTLMDFSLLQDTVFAQIQFIWRFNIIISLFATFIFAEIVGIILDQFKSRKVILQAIAGVGILIVGTISIVRMHNYFIEDPYLPPVYTDENWDDMLANLQMIDYFPSDANYRLIEISAMNVLNSPGIHSSSYRAENNEIIFTVESDKSGYVDTFVVYYLGLVVRSDGEEVDYRVGYRGTVQLFPTKENQTFTISHELTTIQRSGWIITGTTWLGIIIYGTHEKMKKYKR
ncbi:MAG: hypothetical protein ACK5LZ_03235 [Anaerorhabdus sp.]